MDTIIEISGLSKSYGDIKAVNDISFRVRKGEVFGMPGPDGVGKTIRVEIIEGLRIPDAGKVQVLVTDAAKDAGHIKQRIGIQLQSFALFPLMSVQEVIGFFGSLYKKSIPTSEIIKLVVLDEARKVLVKNLSGGQQQRLSVALAFVNDPDTVFLDEPTTGLDPQARRAMWEMIESFSKKGKTIFLTTHYMEEAEQLCDRVAIMDHGRIMALDSPRQMIEQNFKESAIRFKMRNAPGQGVMAALKGVTHLVIDQEDIAVCSENIPATIAALLDIATHNGTDLSDLFVRQATLEDVFLKLAGKRMRD